MMDHRDDWPDGILEGDIDAIGGRDPLERRSVERIARDGRNMNAVLSAMANRVSEGLPAVVDVQPVLERRRPSWRRWTVGPLAAAAAVAALILVRGEGIEESGGPLAPSMTAEMDVETDGPFVVFPTNDPNIAVVWLLNSEESE